MRITIASQNPAKIEAVENAFKAAFPEESIESTGFNASSGVSDQPLTDEETYRGVLNRLDQIQEEAPESVFWIAVEEGIEEKTSFNFGWVVIKSKEGNFGHARLASFYLPEKIMKEIRNGKELGDVTDIITGGENTKQQNGMVGYLTKNNVSRREYVQHAVSLALIPILHPELYE